MVSNHELACLTSTELLEYRRKKSLQQSMPNQTSMRARHTAISGRMMQTKSLRRIGQISVHNILVHACHNGQENMEAWKNRETCLSNRSLCAAAMEDVNVRKNSTVELQCAILNISYGNLEKFFYKRL